MAMTVSELQVVVTADVSKAQSELSSFGNKITSIGGGFATALGAGIAAGTAAMAAGVAVGVKAAGDLEQAVANISTIKPDIDTSQVTGSLVDMSTRVAQSSDQLGESLYNVFSSVEVNQGQALALTEQFARGAVAAQTDAATFGTSVMGVMNAYGIAAEDAGHISDVFFNTIAKGVVTGPELAASLGPVTQSAKAAGVDLNTLGAMIAGVTKEGGPAAQNINNLNNFLQKITTKEAQKEIEGLGIKTKTATGEFRPTTDVLTELKARLGGMTEAARANALQAIFPDAQARIGAQTLISQLDLVKTASAENATASGVADAAYEKMAATFNSQSKILVNGLMGIATTVGTALLPSINTFVKGVSDQVPTAIGIIRELPDAWRTVQQALAGDWSPSDTLSPFINTVGSSASRFKDHAKTISEAWQTIKDALAGQWSPSNQIDPFINDVGKATLTLRDMGREIDRLNESFAGLGRSYAGLTGQFGGGEPITFVARAFRLLVVDIGAVIDLFVTLGSVAMDFVSVALGVSKGLDALRTGNIALAREGLNEADAAWGRMGQTMTEFGTRTVARTQESWALITGTTADSTAAIDRAVNTAMTSAEASVAQGSAGMAQMMEANWVGMEQVTSASMRQIEANTQLGMSEAVVAVEAAAPAATAAATTMGEGIATATETSMTAVTTATETGMAASVGAVEAAAPAATAAATAMGDGMTSAIEAAAPAMADAAGQGAAGAVAAVEGQSGAASGAGQSVGSSLGSGMLAGIQSWVGSIAAAAANMVSQAIGAARAAADAQSPSKEMVKLGEDLSQGLEIGVKKSKLDETMKAQILDFIDATREYIPVGKEIARVEKEIADIREASQRDALFRAEEMVTIDSHSLKLKKDLVEEEKRLLPLRQDIARVSREVADAERGTLDQRRQLIELGSRQASQNIEVNNLEKEKIPLRQRELELERLLLDIDPSSKRAKKIKEEQDEIRKKIGLIDNTASQIRLQTRAEELDAASVKEGQIVASAAARIREQELKDRLRAQETNTQEIKDQIEVLDAEKGAFAANEAVIKNATENEINYRKRLIEVFTAEGKPLSDRIGAGLKLIDQLEKEDKISKELAGKLKDLVKNGDLATISTKDLGGAAKDATPHLDTAADKADKMAQEAADLAYEAARAAKGIDAVIKSADAMPDDWFTPTGSKGGKKGKSASGLSLVPSMQPYLSLVPPSSNGGSGSVQTHQFVIRDPSGQTLAEWYVTGRETAIRYGRVAGQSA